METAAPTGGMSPVSIGTEQPSLCEYARAGPREANHSERASVTASTRVWATGRPEACRRAGAVNPPV